MQQELAFPRLALNDVKAKDQQDAMSFPFFCLNKTGKVKQIQEGEFPVFRENNGTFLRIRASDKEIGVATIWDADIIIYLISMLLEEKKKFDKTGVGINPIDRREYDIQAYDVLTFCSRLVGRKAYLDLAKAMNRLSNTKYLTNIVYNHPNDKGGFKRGVDKNLIAQSADEIQLENELDDEFSWILSKTVISHRSMNRAGKITKVPYAYKLSLHHRFVHSVVGSSSVLRINEDFFKITGGIERWLYRIARKHEGTDRENQMGFIWPMKHLYERSLSSGTHHPATRSINAV